MRHKQTQKKRSLSTIIKVKIPRDFTIEREYFKLRVSRQTFTKEKTVEMALQYVWSLDKDHIPGNTTRQSKEMKKHDINQHSSPRELCLSHSSTEKSREGWCCVSFLGNSVNVHNIA